MENDPYNAVDMKVGFLGVDMGWDWCDSHQFNGLGVDIELGRPHAGCDFPSLMSISRIKCPIDGAAEPMVGSCGSLSTSGRPRHAVSNSDAPSATISTIVNSVVVQSFPMCRSAADSENIRTFSAGVARAWTARRCRRRNPLSGQG